MLDTSIPRRIMIMWAYVHGFVVYDPTPSLFGVIDKHVINHEYS